MKDGTRHTVGYNGYLMIDGDAYADNFHGYSEDGESLGYGNRALPDRFEYWYVKKDQENMIDKDNYTHYNVFKFQF